MKQACYTMPRAPMRLTVKRREEFPPVARAEVPKIVAVDRFTQCHVTPSEVAAALGLIDHGRVIALVPVTFRHDDADTLEYLDENTFATAKVRTKIIEILK